MSEEFIWLSGTLFVILGGIIGVGITAVYKLYAYARAGDALLHDKLEWVRNNYVREGHMKEHLAHIDRRLDELRKDGQERHRDLIERLSSLHK